MAPIGGGPPVGSAGGAFTGAAQALDLYGDFAAAYAGRNPATTDLTTRFEFTTGNYLFIGELTCMGAVNLDSGDLASGYITGWEVFFNGIAVAGSKVDSAQEDQPNECTVPLIIPANTQVEIQNISNGADADRKTSSMITGRIYR